MGKISEIFLSHLDNDVSDPISAGAYYYHQNTLGFGKEFSDDYEKFETSQSIIRKTVIGNAIKTGEVNSVKMHTAMMAISALHNKVIVIAEL